MSALGHVWTAPWQELSDVAAALVGCGHVSGLLMRQVWPLAPRGSPMWTSKNRGRYDRSKLRYPSDLTDDEWRLVEPLIPPGRRGGGKRTVIMREVMNGLMYVL